MDKLKSIERMLIPAKEFPKFKAGDNITVYYKIIEGTKERIQPFRGDVIQVKGSGLTASFTVRKISNGVGVERIFPVHSPNIDKIELNKAGKVRRARIFYQRGLRGKKARILEKKGWVEDIEQIQQAMPEPPKPEETPKVEKTNKESAPQAEAPKQAEQAKAESPQAEKPKKPEESKQAEDKKGQSKEEGQPVQSSPTEQK